MRYCLYTFNLSWYTFNLSWYTFNLTWYTFNLSCIPSIYLGIPSIYLGIPSIYFEYLQSILVYLQSILYTFNLSWYRYWIELVCRSIWIYPLSVIHCINLGGCQCTYKRHDIGIVPSQHVHPLLHNLYSNPAAYLQFLSVKIL